jgi:hypothetical protein
MDFSPHVFIYTLVAGLLWLFIFDILFGEPLHITGGYVDHDHDFDGVQDDPRNSHFNLHSINHHHQTGNVLGHPGEFNRQNPAHDYN